jgi:hypothetical protein
MPKSTRILFVIAVAVTWWTTRCVYEQRIDRMRRATDRRAREVVKVIRDI